jgi:hypothetical protein
MSAPPLKVLILGGYGIFGGRLALLLADEPGLRLIIAGRSSAKAAAFCATLPAGAERQGVALDRNGELTLALAQIAPDLVVDATGPFQAYGEDPYRVVRACIAQGADYLDLADGSDFVKGIARFDVEARASGVSVLGGVSSFPVLTAAVVRRLAQGLARVEAIRGGIAPSPFAGVGLNVIRAISGYAGKGVLLVRDGRQTQGRALTETLRYTIRPPGREPLNNTLFSLVDVPDLQLLPDLWPEARSVWIGAGPVPEILHRALIGLAWLVRLGVIPTLEPLAPGFHAAINRLRWGEHRGGMFVEIDGLLPSGAPVRRSWHLLAEGGDGPLIPSMAVEILVRQRLQGRRPQPGARAATDALELTDYEAAFERRTIHVGQREEPDSAAPLFRRVLGEAFDALPAAVQAMHQPGEGQIARGRAVVERGRGLAARLVAALIGFPTGGADVPVQVSFQPTAGGELWIRDFGGRRFRSLQSEGQGRWTGLVRERFGPVVAGLALIVEGDRLVLKVRRWSLFGLRMPLSLAPRGEAYETAEDGRFRFNVEIGSPLTGLIVRYRGWLSPVDPDPRPSQHRRMGVISAR